MGQMGDLIGAQGAAAAGVLGPAEHPGLEEGAIDDQLPAALEQVEQANLAFGPVEFVRLLDGHPWHPPAFGGQGVAGPHQGLFLHEHLLARSLPFLRRHDWRCVLSEVPLVVLHVSHFVPVHVSLLFLFVLALPSDSLLSDRMLASDAVAAPLFRERPLHPALMRKTGGRRPFRRLEISFALARKASRSDRPVRVTSVSGFRWPLEMSARQGILCETSSWLMATAVLKLPTTSEGRFTNVR